MVRSSFLILLTSIVIDLSFAQVRHSSSLFAKTQPGKFKTTKVEPLKFTSYYDEVGLDSFILENMQQYHIPGLQACIIRDGQIVWERNIGYANIENNVMVSDSTLYLIGSISKTITATAIMQLYEQGLFDLDDNVNDYLPQDLLVANPNFPADPISFEMLLTHTSSIIDNWPILDSLKGKGDYPITLESFLINYLMPDGLYFEENGNYDSYHGPGDYRDYCQVDFTLLGYLVEVISGMSFEQYCRQNIFEPLNMDNTSWFLSNLDTTDIAMPYKWSNGMYDPYGHQGVVFYPAAQLRTNVNQLANFLISYMQNGRYNDVTILDSTTVNLMLTRHWPSPDEWGDYQGLAWFETDDFVENKWLWGHNGAWYGTYADMDFNPNENYGFINLSNIGYKAASWDALWLIINPAIATFADIWSKIYAFDTETDKTYLSPNLDMLRLETKFVNRDNHDFISYLIYISIDSTNIDSIPLYDDGNHNDAEADDGIWGNQIEPISEENEFIVFISTTDLSDGAYFRSHDVARFTTIGPIVYDTHTKTSQLGKWKIKLSLRNEGLSTTAKNIMAELTSPDTIYISDISTNAVVTEIGPQQTVELEQDFYLQTKGSPDSIRFNIKIYSSDYHYWSDNFTLNFVSSIERSDDGIPKVFVLEQNYPNPFNPKTTIEFSLPKTELTTLKIYNTLGQQVAKLVSDKLNAGSYKYHWGAGGLASGLYYYRLVAGEYVATKKLIVIK